MIIDLRSDTVTLPSSEMREDISHADVGDDAYGEDKSTNYLQDYCKELFGVEDALFSTSGMLSNRLAIMSQTSKGDEVITEYQYHINFFDSAAMASVCQVVLNTQYTQDGILGVETIQKAIDSKPRYYYFAQPKLISIENTINGWVGKIFPYETLRSLKSYAKQHQLFIHLDGARIFNAHIETNIPLSEYAKQTNTLSVCFSKGLGAPFGSMLMGRKEVIDRARRFRMLLGSGVHQVGFNAQAAYYALHHNIPLLKRDHENTKLLFELLSDIDEIVMNPHSGQTNMIQFSLRTNPTQEQMFLDACQKQGLLLFSWLPGVIRAVIHQGVDQRDILKAGEIIKQVSLKLINAKQSNYEKAI